MTRATLLRFCRFVLGPLSLALGFSLVTGTMLISGQIIAPPALGAFQKDSIECIEFHTWPSLP
ncbi:MAG TPA: hypothetical protein VI876_09790, partial [Dehalococcoidia bacterium]|nr:hypothetical protein [Dehalococcoidia bacterium]